MYEESATHEIAPAAAEAQGPSRRQLVKAGIWAAPVVVLATASPAAAVSVTSVNLQSSSLGGNKFLLTVTVNGTNSPTARSVVFNQSPSGGISFDTAFPTQVVNPGNFTGQIHVTGNSLYTISVSVGGVVSNSLTVSKAG